LTKKRAGIVGIASRIGAGVMAGAAGLAVGFWSGLRTAGKTTLTATRRFFDVLNQTTSSIYGNFSAWFEPHNIFARSISGTLATNETIFAAVSRLSNGLANLPLKLYEGKFNEINNRKSDLLVNSPNPNMHGFDFIRTMEVCRNTSGNAYAIKEYDDRTFQVKALWILDPARVTPVIEKNTRELWYEVKGDPLPGKDWNTYYVHNMDMIHVKHIHTMATAYCGISPLDVLRNSIDFDGKVKQFSLDLLDTAVKASFILKMSGHINEEKKTEIKDNFRRFYQENGGVLFQEGGYTIEPIKREFLDAKVFEVERITRARVASVYNMPAHMLGETEGAKYAGMEHQSMEFVQDTLAPNARQYEQEFNRKLLTLEERQKGWYFKFNLNARLRGDTRTRAEFYFRGTRSGWFTPNEVRALEELPPLPGGDKLYISKDLIPIDAPPENGRD